MPSRSIPASRSCQSEFDLARRMANLSLTATLWAVERTPRECGEVAHFIPWNSPLLAIQCKAFTRSLTSWHPRKAGNDVARPGDVLEHHFHLHFQGRP